MGNLIFEEDNRQAIAFLERAYDFFSQTSMARFMYVEWSEIMQVAAGRRFDQEGSEDGPWAILRPATWGYRISAGYAPDHPINMRTSEMRQFLTTADIDYRSAEGFLSTTWPERASGEMLHKLQVAQGTSRRREDASTVPRPVINATEQHLDDLSLRLLRDFGQAVR